MRSTTILASLLSITLVLACKGEKDETDPEGAGPTGSGTTESATPASGEPPKGGDTDKDACPDQAPSPWHHRYVVGASPVADMPGLAEAPACTVVFAAGGVVEMRKNAAGEDEPRLTKEGTFAGRCKGEMTDEIFESVALAKVAIEPTSGVDTEQLERGATETLAVTVAPDKKFSVAAQPLDRCDFPLNPGAINNGHNARWTMSSEGCDKVLESVPALDGEEPGLGFNRPSDTVYLRAIGPGRCELTVDYFGVSATIEIQATAG